MMGGPVTLRPYQATAIADLRACYSARNRAPLLVLPTGGGKTVIIAAAIAGARDRGRRCLVVAHRRELIRQASDKLRLAGVPHGIVAPWSPETDDMVQVGSVQTLARRLELLPRFVLIVLDEAHHAVARQWKRLIEAQPNARLLGVTATPQRLDGKGLGIACGGPFDALVEGPSVLELIAGGYLVPSRVFAPPEGPDLSSVRVVRGDFEAAGLAAAMDRPGLVGDAVQHYRRHAAGLPAIAFCASVRHAETVASAFRVAGIEAVAVDGSMHPTQREAALAGLASGAVHVVCAADLISEGLDVPNLGAVILLRPTQSLALHLQQIGRGLRPAPGKDALVVLDHAGNSLRHGLPEEGRRWSLDGAEQDDGPAAAAPLPCPGCGRVQQMARACIDCRDQLPIPDAPAAPPVTRGWLRELRKIAPQMRHDDIKRRDYSERELRVIQRAKGYKRGWPSPMDVFRRSSQSAYQRA